jgi:hypothetical protein
VLPLLLKEKVSALVYADEGDGSMLDIAALDLLVRATSAWLEVISQRKQAHKEVASETQEVAHSAPSNDPFAAHAPLHTGSAKHVPEAAPAAAMSAAAGWGGSSSNVAGDDSDVHRKAQRFARLLMDEIKLYNQAKVSEGRQHRDLYDRLREDIDKSRAAYNKRFADSVSDADYFTSELVRILADNDRGAMGGNFQS